MKHFLTILLLLPVVFGACRKDDMCEQKLIPNPVRTSFTQIEGGLIRDYNELEF